MRLPNFRLNPVVSTLTGILFCGSFVSGCTGGCSQLAKPPETMPHDRIVEGGMQVRISQAGLQKLTADLPGLLMNALGGQNGMDQLMCLGQMSLGPLEICAQ